MADAELNDLSESVLLQLDDYEETLRCGSGATPTAWLVERASRDLREGLDRLYWGYCPPTSIDSLDNYELLEEIGRGGMGVVYKAREIALDREVAVKMMLVDAMTSAEDVERFQKEAEKVAQLDHPNIVPIYHTGNAGQAYFFTTKYFARGNLSKWLGEHSPLRDREAPPSPSKFGSYCRAAIPLLIQAAEAVHHANQRGIIHRDLKPANILIDEDSSAHVADFGLAKRIDDDASLSGDIVGTPRYMAPEQACGESMPTYAVDVYRLNFV